MGSAVQIRQLQHREILARLPEWEAFWQSQSPFALSRHPIWVNILEDGLGQKAYLLQAAQSEETVGLLPLSFVKSRIFGKFLVGLPYLNTAGVMADSAGVAEELIDHAVNLAEQLDVRYLELRHEEPIDHPAFNADLKSKVHMRRTLPTTVDALWDDFAPKVRNQIRKAESNKLSIEWGSTLQVLDAFYEVFSRNMRDLGTPVYPRKLFAAILEQFTSHAEICVVRYQDQPVAGAMLLHGNGITEVPSASSLREFNSTNANMLMYWHLLQRAIERKQQTFDFGRSSVDSNTFRFKKQWGAEPVSATWQYHLRQGDVNSMRPDSKRNQRLIRIWQHLPVWFTRQIGPLVVRGIP